MSAYSEREVRRREEGAAPGGGGGGGGDSWAEVKKEEPTSGGVVDAGGGGRVKLEGSRKGADQDTMSGSQSSAMSLANPSTIHLGPILTPGSNETISIVIPLSAQLATLSRNAAAVQQQQQQQQQQQVVCKQETIDNKDKKTPPKRPKTNPPRIKEDKTKGCPYPNCSRYGRAFSRAHDLKRHIARHESRENKTSDAQHQQIFPCLVCGAHFYNELILQRHKLIHENGANSITSTSGPPYTCNFCKKNFEHEGLLNAHLPIHIKHTSAVMPSAASRYQPPNGPGSASLPPPAPLMPSASSVGGNADDDYRLEDMLLLRRGNAGPGPQKGPAHHHLGSASTSSSSSSSPSSGPGGASKIRCEYCSKTFKTKWTLSSHVAAHEGRFQYQCCICSKRFVRKSHYESHVRSHDAARPYVCEHCGKTFKESKHRREHLKRKHPSNRNAIQSLLDSISACVNEEAAAAAAEQAKLTILMPMNFST